MNALYALAGVFIGWVLAEVAALWRYRREGQEAAALVSAELRANRLKLKYMLDEWELTDALPLDDQDWRTHAAAVLRVSDKEAIELVSEAYHASWYVNQIVGEIEVQRRLTSQLRSVVPDLVKAGEVKGRPKTLEAAKSAATMIARAQIELDLIMKLRPVELLAVERSLRRRRRKFVARALEELSASSDGPPPTGST